MVPVDSREKQKLGILNYIIKENQRRKKDTAVDNKHATVRRRIFMNACLLSLLILSRARSNASRIAPARKQRPCRPFPRNEGWWENVQRNYSEQKFRKTFRISQANFPYMLNNLQADRATVEQVRMLRLKN